MRNGVHQYPARCRFSQMLELIDYESLPHCKCYNLHYGLEECWYI